MRRFRLALAAISMAVTVSVVAPAEAQTIINVPADQKTIQAGIDAANAGDTVLVAPGLYVENIDFMGRAITVTSSEGPAKTIIDGRANSALATVRFHSGESRDSVLSGFTVQNGGGAAGEGFGDSNAGGMFFYASAPTIQNNVITSNACYGIDSQAAAPLIQSNTISNTLVPVPNSCGSAGVAVIITYYGFGPYANAAIVGNTIEDNIGTIVVTGDAIPGTPSSGGILISQANGVVVENNVIRNNGGASGGSGGIVVVDSDTVSIVQNLIYGNTAYDQYGYVSGGISLDATDAAVGPFDSVIGGNTIYKNALIYQGALQGSGDATSGEQLLIDGAESRALVVNNLIVGTSNSVPIVNCNVGEAQTSVSPTPVVFDHDDVFAGESPGTPAPFGSCADPTGSYGNIAVDPAFETVGTDFHLRAGSPAIDAGNNSAPMLPATDLDGNPRVQDGTGLGYPVVDMGVYEYPGVVENAATVLTLTPSTFVPQLEGPPPFTLTAAAQSPAGVPTGPVTFYEDGNVIGMLPLDSTGTATLTPTRPAGGVHAFVATYPGKGVFTPAVSVKFDVLFRTLTTTLTLTSSANPSFLNAPVTFTADLQLSDNAAPGLITLTDTSTGTFLIALTPGPTGTISFTTSSLMLGTHVITATYAGDTIHPAASVSVTQQVILNTNETVLTLTSSANPSALNAAVTFTATVGTNVGVIPAGSVNFTYAGSVIGSQALNGSSTVSVTTSSLPGGDDTVSATYVPSGTLESSSASIVQHVIVPSGFTFTSSVSSLSIETEHHKSLQLQVNSIGSWTGTVSFSCQTPLPPVVTCEFGRSSVTLPANGSAGSTLTLDTDAVLDFKSELRDGPLQRNLEKLMIAALFPLLWFGVRRGGTRRKLTCLVTLLGALAVLSGCGDKYPAHTPPGAYTVVVSATGQSSSGVSATETVSLQLVVTKGQ
jgi:hypothetical protein